MTQKKRENPDEKKTINKLKKGKRRRTGRKKRGALHGTSA